MIDLDALERHEMRGGSPDTVRLGLIEEVRALRFGLSSSGLKEQNAALIAELRAARKVVDMLAEALSEALAEIAYWLPDYLEGGKYFDHPRGSGPDRVTKLGNAALAEYEALR